MSTPSGKPFDPFDLSPYAPRRARERVVPDQSEIAEHDPAVENDYNNDDRDRAAAGQQTAPSGQGAETAARTETAGDVDLARLESSLQWLQREGAVGRLPRAVQLPPVSGLRPVGPEAARARGEQFINGVRVPPSLATERLRPPPPIRERRDNLRGPLRVLLAGVIAAPIAYYFSIGNLTPTSEPAHESGRASLAARLVASTEFPIPKDKLRPGEAEDYNTVISSRNKLAVQPSASAPSTPSARAEIPAALTPTSVPSSVPSPVPTPGPEQAAPAGKMVRELDPQSVKLLLQQGEQFVSSGDLVTARLVYRRAAEAGSAAAALALGATYDPAVLAKIGARGIGADVEKARSWYEKAKEYGSPDAPRRIEMLANR